MTTRTIMPSFIFDFHITRQLSFLGIQKHESACVTVMNQINENFELYSYHSKTVSNAKSNYVICEVNHRCASDRD